MTTIQPEGSPFSAEVYSEYAEVDCASPMCGGEHNIFAPAYFSTAPIFIPASFQNRRDANIKCGETEFDYTTRTIIVKDLVVRMNLSTLYMANDFVAFNIALGYESQNNQADIFSTDYFMKNKIWTGQAILNNGKITTNGNLDITGFTFSSENPTQMTATFKATELRIQVPLGYNLDDVIVYKGVDSGNLGYGISEKFAIKEAKETLVINQLLGKLKDKFEFSNYPNPVKDLLNIQVELEKESNAKILLYDLDGTLKATIYEGSIKAATPINLSYNISKVEGFKPKNVYFLRLITNDKTLIRKVIVN